MKKFALILLTMALATTGWAQVTTQVTARVKTDRVNLRAKPNTASETVDQASAGQILQVRTLQDQWVEVVPPETTDFWVHKEFVEDDTVLVERLNVRSGAGINYNVVGSFAKGDKIQRRGSFGEWMKVAAPPNASLWINRELVDVVIPAPDVPPPESAPAASGMMAFETNAVPLAASEPMVDPSYFEERPVAAPGMMPVASPPGLPPGLRLVPLDGQGRDAIREGELKRAPTLFANPPSDYRLVRRDGKKLITTAFVVGNVNQLESLLGEYLVIRGKEYWVEKRREPVMVIEAIEKRAYY